MHLLIRGWEENDPAMLVLIQTSKSKDLCMLCRSWAACQRAEICKPKPCVVGCVLRNCRSQLATMRHAEWHKLSLEGVL